jgi:hypothetical protein
MRLLTPYPSRVILRDRRYRLIGALRALRRSHEREHENPPARDEPSCRHEAPCEESAYRRIGVS